MVRTLAWFSCGAASAVATKLVPEAQPVYCDTGAEDADNQRFLKDCETWFKRPVTVLRSDRYVDTWDLWERRRYLSGVDGALCTVELKVVPRLSFQRPDDIHLFGYTADAADTARALRLKETYPELHLRFPLIERGLTKPSCLAILHDSGISAPRTYAMGFPNANCLPCVKATSPAYWALVRQHEPELFDRMAKLSRSLNVRLCRLNGDRAFIDEIAANHPTTDPIVPSCDFLCHIAELDLAEK